MSETSQRTETHQQSSKIFDRGGKAGTAIFLTLILTMVIFYFIQLSSAKTHQQEAKNILIELCKTVKKNSSYTDLHQINLYNIGVNISDSLRYTFEIKTTKIGFNISNANIFFMRFGMYKNIIKDGFIITATAIKINWPIQNQWIINQDGVLYKNTHYINPYDKN